LAGRKQHYIPQVVQRAFEAARTGTKSQVFVFRKGRLAYLTSTEGAAAERDFYSNPLIDGKGALDDKITDFEADHLGPILRELRSIENDEVDPELAAITVAHLAFRTAHLRGAMATMVDSTLGQVKSIIEIPEAMRRFAGIDSMPSDSVMAEMVRDELSKFGLNAWPEKDRKAIERMVIFRLRERFDDLVVHANGFMRDGLAAIETGMSGAVAKVHARALSNSLVPQERVRALRELNWHIIGADTQDRHFILPDCVVVASSTAPGELKPFAMLSGEETAIVIMPLSSRQLLIGSGCATQVAQIEINLQLAKCSLDFFISSKHDEATRTLAESIGTCAVGLKPDLLGEGDEGSSEMPHTAVPTAGRLVIRTPVGKFGEAAKKILSTIVEEAVEPTSVNRMESITVPANMQAALEAIWKRTPNAAELQAAALGTVELVKSGSEWKCRVIVPRSVAEMLVQTSDSEKRLIATRLVKINLGRAYYIDCWAKRCPEVFDRPELDLWGKIVSKVTSRAASYHFGGLASARHESEPLPGGDTLQELASYLRLGFTGLREARQRFFTHRDVDQLILEAIPPIEFILVSTASVCGFLEAKNTAIARDSDAGIVLSDAGLWEWSLLFAKDLRRHYEKRYRWSSEAELHQLGGHVERLLWTIGTIVSPTDNGHWIDVLDDERMELFERALRE
jgi:hypothetical protein